MISQKYVQTDTINILLADDDQDDCDFFKEVLDELPLLSHLTYVKNGEQLMQLLNQKSEHIFNVLFIDLNMPKKNGFTCLEEIKSNDNLKHLPTIILSTSFEESAADSLYKKGAHYYICKPSDLNQLKIVIHLVLTLIIKNSPQPPRDKFFLSHLNEPEIK